MKQIYDLDPEVWEMAGPLSPMRRADADRDWVTIKSNGECNREIEIPRQVADVQRIRLKQWLDFDMADYSAFSACETVGGECRPGSDNTEECPFSIIKDEMTGRSCCCYTVLAGNTCVVDWLDDISAFLDGNGPPLRQVPKFRAWVQAMMNFYKKACHSYMKSEVAK